MEMEGDEKILHEIHILLIILTSRGINLYVDKTMFILFFT